MMRLTCEGGGGLAAGGAVWLLSLGRDGLEGRQTGQRGLGQLHPKQGQGAELPDLLLLRRRVSAALVLLLELLLHVGREDTHLLHLVIQSPRRNTVLSTRLEGGHACQEFKC